MTVAKNSALRRRGFLKLAAGGLLSLPLLESVDLRGMGLSSAGVQHPRRLICICSSNGQHGPHWAPRVDALGASFPLSDITGDISSILGSGFNRLKNKMLLLRGLDFLPLDIDEHWASKSMNGYGTTYNRKPTLDQIVAASPGIYAGEPTMRSLFLMAPGGRTGGGRLVTSTYSYAGQGDDTAAILPITDPRQAFDALFRKGKEQPNNPRIADQIRKQYLRLKSDTRLSSLDKSRVALHVSLFDDLERRLAVRASTCSTTRTIDFPPNEGNYREQMRSQFAVAALAIQCDLTRVVRINLGHGADNHDFRFLPGVLSPAFHETTHEDSPQALREVEIISRCQADLVADFLATLDQVEDPGTGRTFLDNSIVYWSNEVGTRPHAAPANIHDSLDMPVLIAGDGGGVLKTGRYIDYRRKDVFKRWQNAECASGVCEMDASHSQLGRPYNELLVTLLDGMGLNRSEWEKNPGDGFGDYRGNELGQYDLRTRDALPDLLNT